MAVTVNSTIIKYLSQWRNGDDFSLFPFVFTGSLKGGIMEKIKVVFQVEYFNTFFTDNAVDFFALDADSFRIRLLSGETFENEGFYASQAIQFKWIGTVNATLTGNIDFISDTEIVVVNSSTDPTTINGGQDTINGFQMQNITDMESMKYKYGIIENQEAENYLSKLTNTEQSWLIESIDFVTHAFSEGVARGPEQGWLTGASRAKFVEYRDDYTDAILPPKTASIQVFEIEQEFIILPFFQNGELTNIRDLVAPELFLGNNSVKHIVEYELREEINFQDSSQVARFGSNLTGSVGWFNESFNGNPNTFGIENLAYEDDATALPLTGINGDGRTKITFRITSADGDFASDNPFVVYHSILPSINIYRDTLDDFVDTWVFENVRSEPGDNKSGTALQNVTATFVDANNIDVECFIEYNASQKNRIANGENYLLALTVGRKSAITVNDSKTVTLKVDLNTVSRDSDIPGLLAYDRMDIYPHSQDFDLLTSAGFQGGILFNEDGLMLDYELTLDLSKFAVLEDLKIGILAFNTVTEEAFIIQENTVDLSSITIVSGVQRINLQSLRGFNLPVGSQFDFVNLADTVGTPTTQQYRGQLGFKMSWQEWNVLLTADTIFYDDTEPNNNLNQKTSNYSGSNNYEIRVFIDARVLQGANATIYRHMSQDIEIPDYGIEPTGNVNWDSVTIETFDLANNNLNLLLQSGVPTKIKATYVPTSPLTPDPLDFIGIIRLEQFEQPGFDIWESSTLRGIAPGSPIGETSISKVGDNIILECQTVPINLAATPHKISTQIESDDQTVSAYSEGYTQGYDA